MLWYAGITNKITLWKIRKQLIKNLPFMKG
jgi:hypothetical protein